MRKKHLYSNKNLILFSVIIIIVLVIYLISRWFNFTEYFSNNTDDSKVNNYIEHIFYINLDKRTDRKKKFENQASLYNLNVERFQAIQKDMGALGCTLSHLEVLKIARERNYKNVLIFEDDFEFLVDKEDFEKEIKQIFENNVDFDVLLISYNLIKYEDSEKYPFLLRSLDVQTTSGYIVNEHYYDKLIDLFEYYAPLLEKTGDQSKYACDIIWKQFQTNDKWYCTKTRIGRQIDGYSDITSKNESYNV
jgi:glycosyl transferase family 25